MSSRTTFSPSTSATTSRSRRSAGGSGQLTLIESPAADWQLDEHTRAVGRAGLAQARAALAAATPEADSASRAA